MRMPVIDPKTVLFIALCALAWQPIDVWRDITIMSSTLKFPVGVLSYKLFVKRPSVVTRYIDLFRTDVFVA